ncbi:aldose 1-epimerase family protein [Nocardioides panacihumi]|uniref:Aldose 1-epimerase family protein n=1 Tax=Nocardioides panacihumi TaxID=400774 RepID=A0ABN2QIR4_9ACTN
MTFAPSGQQHEIGFEDQHATIVEVGGGIREYRVGDRDVLQPYERDSMCDGAHGAPLIPWPNRLADGWYRFDGVDHQVALTEPDKHNAIHGFLHWRSWQPVENRGDGLTMATTLLPLEGYPFALEVQIDYRLGPGGLTVTITTTNIGDRTAPYGCGQHPYLSPGEGPIDGCTIRMEADTRILTDPQRKLPAGRETVTGTAYDFRAGTELGDLKIDHAFTDLHRDLDGRAWVHLTGTDGRTVQLWVDESYGLLELFTGDTLAPGRRRRGLGVEPMTCPPNAFQSGVQVTRLDSGHTATASWGVSLVD